MRCASAKLALAFILALLWAGFSVAAEYKPIERPAIRTPALQEKAKSGPATINHNQGKTRNAPASEEKVQSKGARIPSFNKKETGKQPQEEAPAAQEKRSEANPGRIKLFNTVEFKRPLDTLPGWLDVLKRNKREPVFIPEKYFDKRTTWNALQGQANQLNGVEQLRLINRFWNGWPYREDIVNWGKQDYWAIPAQFLAKSGDCEDYAIAKYFTLKELGVNPQNMRIVVLRDTIRNLPHAVLAVYLDNDVYILDNVTNVVLSHKRIRNYSPQFSVNEFGRWAHIKGKPAS